MASDGVYCEKCDWSGSSENLITFEKSNHEYCPDCGEPDSIIEKDSIYDYESENPRENIT